MVDVRDEVIWDQWDIRGAWYSGDGIILVGLYFFKISFWDRYLCVCVNHLEKCKTSNLAGGRWGTLQSAANEDAAMFLWKRTCNFPVFRQWQPAKPRTGMSVFQQFSNYCTVFAIWLSCIRTSKSFEQGRRKISSHSFSLPIIKPFLSGLTEVFLHVRCIPHQ